MFPKQNEKVPELRFSGFTDDWEQRKLGELGSVSMNRRIFKEETTENGEIPFYKIGTFGTTADAYISRSLFEKYKEKYPYPAKGDLLISASGSIGRIVEYNGEDEYFQDSNIVWLKHDNRLINSFLKQFYSIVKWEGLEGSTIKRLYNKNILETKIELPKPQEQTKIGNFFKQLDETIALQERKLDLLKEQKKGYLQKMFPKQNEKVPELRFSGFTDDWEERKLGEEVESIGTGKSKFITGKKKSLENPYPVLGSTSVISYDAEFDNSGDFILTARVGANAGNLYTYSGNVKISDNTVYIKSKNLYFIYYLLLKFNLKQLAFGTGQPLVKSSELKQLRLMFSNGIKEQQKIGSFFKQLDDTIALQERLLNT
ncbi:restriction endonuclease subunit S [Vagococcus fluvialis]|uniref:restriction endonuclease subunit S n=1 Tax=Vagococcus fluvialis TaxID=2738 RepID=UPI001D0B27DD|nr:restriction endonuclease subunit S [Vagococcus fluvialis]